MRKEKPKVIALTREVFNLNDGCGDCCSARIEFNEAGANKLLGLMLVADGLDKMSRVSMIALPVNFEDGMDVTWLDSGGESIGPENYAFTPELMMLDISGDGFIASCLNGDSSDRYETADIGRKTLETAMKRKGWL